MEPAERMALGMVDAERKRRTKVPDAEVLEIDGLVLCFSNLPDPSINSIVVEHAPRDPGRAMAAAEEAFVQRDQVVGIDLQVGRHPELDRTVRAMGLALIIERPGMTVGVADLGPAPIPDGVEVRLVRDDAEAAELAQVDAEAFGGDLAIGAAFYSAGAHGVGGVHAFVARQGGAPVGIAVGYLHRGAVGVMGVGVVPRARRRGLGAALTAHTVRSFPGADMAWLHPTPEARAVYERIGFREVAAHEVWIREHPDPAPTG
jgi:GNAT superfamily N-acetyltransferase